MAFPTQQTTLEDALSSAMRRAKRIRDVAVANRDTMAAQSVSADFFLVLLDDLRAAREVFDAAGARAGMAAYAQEQIGRDVAADFNTMISAVDGAITYIITAIPKDAENRILAVTIDAQGDRSPVLFSSADTATLRSRLDDVIVTIEG